MDDDEQSSMKSEPPVEAPAKETVPVAYCGACLMPSTERELVPVQELAELYKRLTDDDADASTSQDIIPELCWECRWRLRGCERFRRQAQRAQATLRLCREMGEENTNMAALTSLQATIKTDYDYIIEEVNSIKSESVDYDIIIEVDPSSADTKPKPIKKYPMRHAKKILVPKKGSDPSGKMKKVMLKKVALPQGVDLQSMKPKGWVTVRDGDKIRKMPVFDELTKWALDQRKVSAEEARRIVSGARKPKQKQQVITPVLVNAATGKVAKTTGADGELQSASARSARVVAKSEIKKSVDNIHYMTVVMTEDAMQSSRELERQRPEYLNAPHKCESCCLGYSKQSQLADHKTLKHTPRASYQKCPVCSVYHGIKTLNEHIRNHYTLFQCRTCDFTHRQANRMWRHVMTHTSPPHKCNVCNKAYRSKTHLSKHMSITHPTQTPVSCNICQKTYKSEAYLMTHVKNLHENVDREPIACPTCGRTYLGQYNLQVHIKKKHTEKSVIREFYCEPCGRSFADAQTLQAHNTYTKAHLDPDAYKHACDKCEKRFPHPKALKKHYDFYHLGKTDFNCDQCGKMFLNNHCLKMHRRHVHQGVGYTKNKTCDECGKCFAGLSTLKNHMALHSSARPFVCEVCGATFRYKAALYTHNRRLHLGIRPARPEDRLLDPSEPTVFMHKRKSSTDVSC